MGMVSCRDTFTKKLLQLQLYCRKNLKKKKTEWWYAKIREERKIKYVLKRFYKKFYNITNYAIAIFKKRRTGLEIGGGGADTNWPDSGRRHENL